MEFRRDEDGTLLAAADNEMRPLAIYFQSDIQGDTIIGGEIRAMVEDAMLSPEKQYESIGNTCCLRLGNGQACIESLAEDAAEVFCLPLPDFSEALNAWLDFVLAIPENQPQ